MKRVARELGQGLKRAVAYLRRSTDRQEQSIEDQKRACLEWAALHGYEIVAFYIDDAVSGTSTKGRNDFLRLMDDVKRPGRGFDLIIIYSFSRFSRSDVYETFSYLNLLKKNGVKLESCTENLNGDMTGVLMEFFSGFKAHTESRDLSRDTLRGLISSAEGGWWNGGKPCHGYDLEYVNDRGEAFQRLRFNPDGTKMLLDLATHNTRLLPKGARLSVTKKDKCQLILSVEDRWQVIVRIFDTYVNQGRGFRAIAQTLNGEGILSPNGKRWTTGTIRSIIENPIYTGTMVWNRRASGKFHRVQERHAVPRDDLEFEKFVRCGEDDWIVVENAHTPIIDDATFVRAQELLKERSRKHGAAAFRSGRAKTSPYLLSGLIHCLCCGHKYHGRYVAKGKRCKDGTRPKTYYYGCNSYINGKRAECPKSIFRRDPLEADVLGRVEARVDWILNNGGREKLRTLIAKELTAERSRPEAERGSVNKQIRDIDAKIDNLLESLTPENKRFVDPKLVALGEEKDALEGRLRELDELHREEVDIDALADGIVATVSSLKDVFPYGTIEEQKELIGLFVEKIELDPDKRVGKVYMKRFPVPTNGTGESFGMVAGAGFEPATFGL